MNLPAILVAALVPTFMGYIWYNPKVFGTVWMKASGVTDEMIKKSNMAVVLGVSLVLSFLLSAMLTQIVIHQTHIYSLVVTLPGFKDAGSDVAIWYADFLANYGDLFRTFGHGFFHGIFAGLFLALPILGTNAMFERKGFGYIAINSGYWILTMALMGGILGAWK